MPVFYLASLAAGLGPESRTGMYMTGVTARPELIMLANIFDAVNLLTYSLAGAKGDPPISAAERYYIEHDNEPKKDIQTFNSGEEFEKRRNELLQKIKQ